MRTRTSVPIPCSTPRRWGQRHSQLSRKPAAAEGCGVHWVARTVQRCAVARTVQRCAELCSDAL
eukprot:scaffold7821_cov99-Isochrysis_galbana.AAC.1